MPLTITINSTEVSNVETIVWQVLTDKVQVSLSDGRRKTVTINDANDAVRYFADYLESLLEG